MQSGGDLRIDLNISQKGFLLVCVPLVFELIFVAVLWSLVHETEKEIKRETAARQISSQTSVVVRDLLDFVVGAAGYSVLKTTRFTGQYESAIKNLPQEFKKLSRLLEDQKEKQQSVDQMAENFERGVRIANDARIKMENGEILAATKLLPKLQVLSIDASQRLYELAKEERQVEAESPLIQKRLRENLNYCLALGIVFNISMCLALAFYFSRNITDRLRTMRENSSRLAMGQALLARVGGNDEIDFVDTSFHKMAEIIAESTRRERTLVENAEAVICSLDCDGKFVAINNAALSLWKYEPDDLLGRRVVDILEESDRLPFLEALTAVTKGEKPFPRETMILTKDGAARSLVWSAHFSETERQFICVVHDITERKRQEELVHLAEQSFRAIIDNIPLGIALCTVNGTVEMINPALDQMFSLTASSKPLVGKSISILFGESTSGLEFTPEALHEQNVSCEARRSNGEKFPVEISCHKYQTKEGLRYLTLITDITERQRVERLKQEFLMILSHELRSPLTTLKLLLELLSEGLYGSISDQGLKKIASAERNITRLVKMIQELLDLETIESGNISIVPVPVEIKDVLEKAVEACRGSATAHKVKLVVESEEARVMGDEDRLIQVIINLVSNAVKFSPKESTITVIAERNEKMAKIKIIDSGPGIPDHHKQQIFERFRQVDETESRKKGGVGLGLAICKVIVDKHGGTIAVESEEGKGSTFWFSVPLSD